MRGRPIILHLLICLFYPLQCDIISLTDIKIPQAILLALCKNGNFNFSILGFRYFEFLFIYERILRIRIFSIFVLALLYIANYMLATTYLSFYNRSWTMTDDQQKDTCPAIVKTLTLSHFTSQYIVLYYGIHAHAFSVII